MIKQTSPSLPRRVWQLAQLAGQRRDAMLVAGFMLVVFMLILPLPTSLVDVLISVNIAAALVVLSVSFYCRQPLEFSSFPSVLLMTTLFRLALTISTSRLILLNHDAGQIVYTFGNFVVGGNVAVGIVVFAILTIVQFIVITKGADRVAEVTARFALDGMPGQQMSIDADVRAGSITAEQAKNSRSDLLRACRFYAAMDGAMKFVKGDAIASIMVVLVNIFGGIAIGSLEQGMPIGEALKVYAVLSVGDGLVAQVPALLISMTAALLVTRVPSPTDESLTDQLSGQLGADPLVLFSVACGMLVFALVPGFPGFIFVTLALLLFGGWYGLKRARRKMSMHADAAAAAPVALAPALTLRLGGKAAPAVQLKAELERWRAEILASRGIPLKHIELHYESALNTSSVEFLLYQIPVMNLDLPEGKGLVSGVAAIEDEAGKNFRLPWGAVMHWIGSAPADEPGIERYPVHIGVQRITALLSAMLDRYADELIGIQEVRNVTDEVEREAPELVRELQRAASVQRVTDVLRRLAAEQISIRNRRAIFQAIIEWSSKEKDVVLLTEYVRVALRREICYALGGRTKCITGLLVGEKLEAALRESVRETSAGSYSILNPARTDALLANLHALADGLLAAGKRPVLITALDVRRYLRKMIEVSFFNIPVISTQELDGEVTVDVQGYLEFDDDSLETSTVPEVDNREVA